MKKKLNLLDELFEMFYPFRAMKKITDSQEEILIKLKEIKMLANEFEAQLAGVQAVFEKAFAEVVEEVAGLQAEIVAAQNANAQLPESLVARAANLAALAQKFDDLNADKVEEVAVVEAPAEVTVELVSAPLEAPVEVTVTAEEVAQ